MLGLLGLFIGPSFHWFSHFVFCLSSKIFEIGLIGLVTLMMIGHLSSEICCYNSSLLLQIL